MAKAKMFEHLFQPGNIGKLKLKNRLIKAPTDVHLGSHDGSVNERLIRYYREEARGGLGLIIVEFAYVDHKASQSTSCQLCVADNEYVAGLSLLSQAIQAEGAKAALQIAHAGRQKFLGVQPIKAPSAIPWEQLYAEYGPAAMPQALTFEEIQEIIEAFGAAAQRVVKAGFDMLEVHAAHGYLLTNFLSPRTNKRTDWYGGSLENRMRFLLEIVSKVRQKIGPDFPLSVRLSGTEYEPDGIMIEESVETAKALEKLGVNAIHVSGGIHHRLVREIAPMGIPRGNQIWAAEAVKKAVKIPVIASGSINIPELAEETIAKGKADFISMGRPIIADPHWANKAREGRPEDIVICIRCNECLDRGAHLMRALPCTVNPTFGREDELAITPAPHPRKVAIIGGGPAGMEAARVCTLRGHNVTVFEKRELGGALLEASVPDFKDELKRLLKYYTTQMNKLKVKVVKEEATLATIKKGGFDAVIVATGATPMKPKIAGIDKPNVSHVIDVFRGTAKLGKKVVIIGGGIIGVEAGLYLMQQGKQIAFTTRQNELMSGITLLEKTAYNEELAEKHIKIYTGKELASIKSNGVVVIGRNKKEETIPADSVVLNSGYLADTKLTDQLQKEADLDVYAVGDCVAPRRIFDAIHEGFMAARWV